MVHRVDPYGPHALLVSFSAANEASLGHGHGPEILRRHLEKDPPAGLLEMTPGFTTLLLEFKPRHRPDPSWVLRILSELTPTTAAEHSHPRTVEIPVRYDGPDLPRVAQVSGMSVRDVIRLHSEPTYHVQILGFAPGFPYLAGLDRRLHVPRLATPRPRIPAGSVAIGGEHTGIYPIATAGGWNILGHTPVPLVDAALAAQSRADAFRLHPGDAVRFVPSDASTHS